MICRTSRVLHGLTLLWSVIPNESNMAWHCYDLSYVTSPNWPDIVRSCHTLWVLHFQTLLWSVIRHEFYMVWDYYELSYITSPTWPDIVMICHTSRVLHGLTLLWSVIRHEFYMAWHCYDLSYVTSPPWPDIVGAVIRYESYISRYLSFVTSPTWPDIVRSSHKLPYICQGFHYVIWRFQEYSSCAVGSICPYAGNKIDSMTQTSGSPQFFYTWPNRCMSKNIGF